MTNRQSRKPAVDVQKMLQRFTPEQLANIRGNIPPLPEPKGIVRKRADIAGAMHTWYEYVPASYTGEEVVPLIIGLHGGGSTGLKFATSTLFHEIAEKENFIVVYPEATLMYEDAEGRHHEWNAFYMNNQEMEETDWLRQFVEKICSVYAIDRSRIYLTGHSNGDQMALQFAVRHTGLFAACAGLNGPTHPDKIVDMHGNRLQPQALLPYLRWHGELDPLGGNEQISRQEINERLNEYWIDHNNCNPQPQFQFDGKLNTTIYASDNNAEVRFVEYKGGPHRLNIELANVVWYEFFRRFARHEDGSIIELDVAEQPNQSDCTVALVNGCATAYVNGSKVPIGGAATVVDECVFVPVQFMAEAFGADIVTSPDLQQALITVNIRSIAQTKTAVVKADHPALWINHHVYELPANPYIKDGALWIPIQAITSKLLDMHAAALNGTFCIHNRYFELGANTARIISRTLADRES
jgi:poly(3-hydroxybutyrate) depolymerase